MTALICTCIRAHNDPRWIAILDPDCQHATATADRDARRAAQALGRLVTITTGLALIAVGVIATAPGQIGWPTAAWIAGTALIARLVYIASKENPS